MKIEVGDTVELNNGEVHEVSRMIGDDPEHADTCGFGPFVVGGVCYRRNGVFADRGPDHSLSVKRIVSFASDDTPNLWRDMVDEEKGALLLADHEGAAIHVWEPIAEAWRPLDLGEVMFQDDKAYRIAPAITREPIKIQGPSGEILGSGTMLQRDGEWDFDSIAVEEQ